MHDAAMNWVARHVPSDPLATVLDLGGRDINGSVRPLFPKADLYTVVDMYPGVGVDVVADASQWRSDREYDVVVACEVFEHTHVWPDICLTAFASLRSGGIFIATMAGPGRQPHSGIDGLFRLHPGEYYGNVAPDDLERVLKSQGWIDVAVDHSGLDTRVVATRP